MLTIWNSYHYWLNGYVDVQSLKYIPHMVNHILKFVHRTPDFVDVNTIE